MNSGLAALAVKPSFTSLLRCILTLWVVAVHIPSLTLVQPVTVVHNADLALATLGASSVDGVANTPFVEPSSCAHMEPWKKEEDLVNVHQVLQVLSTCCFGCVDLM